MAERVEPWIAQACKEPKLQKHGLEAPRVLNIAVSGHRKIENVAAVRRDVAIAFDLVCPFGAQLRVLSPLAEGADRIVAAEALRRNVELQCPLPFFREEYEKDFSPASREEFRALLGRAGSVFELDGEADRRAQAYLRAGQVLLSHADLLIAVWDGDRGAGVGGTADIVTRALADKIPVIWIDPTGTEPISMAALHRGRLHRLGFEALEEDLKTILTPISVNKGDPHEGLSFEIFSKERESVLSYGFIFDAFVNLLRGREGLAQIWRNAEGGGAAQAWRAIYSSNPQMEAVCTPCIEGDLAHCFARADTLAKRYAGLYRSTFLLTFMLSALAVVVAISGGDPRSLVSLLLEFVMIGLIVLLTWVANARHWHERWIEYRQLAEQLRPIRFLFPLGMPLPRRKHVRAMGERLQSSDWVHWLVARLERTVGLPNVKLDAAYLNNVSVFCTQAVIDDQVRYHTANAEKLHQVDHRLHKIGQMLFQLTAAACLGGILLILSPATLHGARWWSFVEQNRGGIELVSALVPAFGAAILGIRNVGEFRRLEHRSRAMAASLQAVGVEVEHDREREMKSARLASHCELVATQMMSETADWRTLLITRRIELPA